MTTNAPTLPPTKVITIPSTRRPDKSPAFAPRHVLVATDLTVAGNTAVPYALSLLRDGGVLTVMHVTPVAPVIRARMLGLAEAMLPGAPEAIRAVAAQLRELVPVHASEDGIFTRVEVVAAVDAGVAIAKTAERLSADVICLGIGARSPLSRAVFGSVTRNAVSHARRPVLLVPADSPCHRKP